ncbi:MAG: hypothetical protein WCW53_03775 [Syntrophales bacterium]
MTVANEVSDCDGPGEPLKTGEPMGADGSGPGKGGWGMRLAGPSANRRTDHDGNVGRVSARYSRRHDSREKGLGGWGVFFQDKQVTRDILLPKQSRS